MKTKLLIVFCLVFFIYSCEEDKEETIPFGETSTVEDYDGNVYTTVRIGNQWWMAANLKVTHYNDGSEITFINDRDPITSDLINWENNVTGAYCVYYWYNHSDEEIINTYGYLYNWNAVNSNKLCPDGWHIPTKNDWEKLEDYLGGYTVAGKKLKSTNYWTDGFSLAPGTNESYFNALPGGYCYSNGASSGDINEHGYWWSSTEHPWDETYEGAWSLTLNSTDDYSEIGGIHKGSGLSIRCIKD